MIRRLFLACVLAGVPCLEAAAQVGTSFSYQGRLYEAGMPASGQYALRVTPFDAAIAGTALAPAQTIDPVSVSDGVFTVMLDFGPAVFVGGPVWLAVEVDGPGTDFVLLEPRQPVSPTPYSMLAERVGIDGIDSFALQDGAVTPDKLAPGAVGAAQIDPAQVQRRIGAGCAAGEAIAEVAQDGGITCVATGDDDWFNGSEANTTDKKVAIGNFGYTGAQLFVDKDSTLSAPQVELRERGSDYSRLTLSNVGPEHFSFWTIAARSEPESLGGPATDRINFYNSRLGDLMVLTGERRLGIGVFSPTTELDVSGNARLRGLAFSGTGTRPLHVTTAGVLTAPAPATRYVPVPAASFGPVDSDTSYVRFFNEIHVDVGTESVALVAPAHLPDGATITEFRLHYLDNDPSNELQFILCRAGTTASSTSFCESLAIFETSGASAEKRSSSVGGLSVAVDNFNYQYFVIAGPPFGSVWGAGNLRIHATTVGYR